PRRRQAHAPAHRPREGARQHHRRDLLHRRARRAVLARSADRGRRHPGRGSGAVSTTIRVGTRASLLARTQAGQVADALRSGLGVEVELVDVTTTGDVSSEPLAVIGGTGVFVSALRDALLDRRVDVAVHSLKDLPTLPPAAI